MYSQLEQMGFDISEQYRGEPLPDFENILREQFQNEEVTTAFLEELRKRVESDENA